MLYLTLNDLEHVLRGQRSRSTHVVVSCLPEYEKDDAAEEEDDAQCEQQTTTQGEVNLYRQTYKHTRHPTAK